MENIHLLRRIVKFKNIGLLNSTTDCMLMKGTNPCHKSSTIFLKKLKAIEYWKYLSFNKFLMPRFVELNNWVHANKGDLPHVTCLQHDIKQESSLADEKCLQKIFLLA